ncbi:MAG TPA: protein-disulfide isomerase [Bacteroidales bacterium]|jgi:peroxiredoxin|nr:protein-disulfide isomerase [Bacteroidales bacterium]
MRKTILIFSVLLIGLYSCNYKEKKAEREAKEDVIKSTLIKVRQEVPEFTFITLSNDTVNINALKGKIVFMNFFATSCPICIKELPFIESDIWAKHKDNKNFELIVFGREHNADEMISFKEKTGYTFNIVPDPGRKIYSLFAERYIPRNIVLDREGRIIYQATGFDDKEFAKLKETIEKELSKQ